MAYLAPWSRFAVAQPLDAVAPPPRLGRIERDVLLLSRRDGRASIAPPGRFRRTLGTAFGMRAPNTLADPRLEALRRFAVLLRHDGDAIDPGEEGALAVAGFAPPEIAVVRALVGREKPIALRATRSRFGMAMIAATTLFAAWLADTVERLTGDRAIAFVVTVLALVTFAAPLGHRAPMPRFV